MNKKALFYVFVKYRALYEHEKATLLLQCNTVITNSKQNILSPPQYQVSTVWMILIERSFINKYINICIHTYDFVGH